MGVILFGPPGAGKGTQAATLARRTCAVHISTGEILRGHVREGTGLGRAAREHLDAGRYVPDAIINSLVREGVRASGTDGAFILDGYPRTVAQAEYLDLLLSRLGLPEVAVVALVVEQEELLRRLLHRGDTGGRSDDTEAVVRDRQAVYLAETEPLLARYRERGGLREVDGTGDPAEVAARVDAALAELSSARLRGGV